ncbi:MAG TPA: TylF/MycF/NovP-related O-methyltransferase [Segetibacter sp.]|nr:TylF/MycF/NovP-related O-methyltransferase [Segetibacter sp.]
MKDIIKQLIRSLGYTLSRIPSNIPAVEEDILTINDKTNKFQYEIINLHRYAPWLTDEKFQQTYTKIKDYTLVDQYRCYELFDFVKRIENIEGDIIEIGVWRGGTSAIMAAALQSVNSKKTIFLCDTFSGVVKAGEFDIRYKGGEHSDTSDQLVKDLLSSLQLKNFSLLKGIFPEQTGSAVESNTFSLCHIDVDVYQSAVDIIAWIYPRLSKGGALIFDDYGFRGCNGITYLVNELRMEVDKWLYLYNLNGHAILIKR